MDSPPDSMLMDQAGLVAMFEYMIGNTDWDISMMRNVRLIQAAESGKVCVVPYDFRFFRSGQRTIRQSFFRKRPAHRARPLFDGQWH